MLDRTPWAGWRPNPDDATSPVVAELRKFVDELARCAQPPPPPAPAAPVPSLDGERILQSVARGVQVGWL